MQLKIKSSIFLTLIFIVFLNFYVLPCRAEPVLIKSLVENPAQYDKKKVTVRGEVIGDIMRRGEYTWLNILEDGASLGVWVLSALAEKIKFSGSYAVSGDRVIVQGTFFAKCPVHAADLDLHADSFIVEFSGRNHDYPLNAKKLELIFALGVAIVFFSLLSTMRRR